MMLHMLKAKIHRATVTNADLNYEGPIAICPELISAAGLRLFEVVDIYNINNGARFSTYVIEGKSGEICLNGAAARQVHRGDLVIIANYAYFTESELSQHEPQVVFVNEKNKIKRLAHQG